MWGNQFVWGVCLSLSIAYQSEANVGVLLHESLGSPYKPIKASDTGFWAQGGHAGIFIDNLCAASPIKLRRCQDGEHPGVIISRYDGLSAEEYDWVAVPVNRYFYGVESSRKIPLIVNKKVLEIIRVDHYKNYLYQAMKSETHDGLPEGRWIDTTAAAYRRDIYTFMLNTTAEQDQFILDHYNADPNTSRFSFFRSNCADFAKEFMTLLFPVEIGRNINDALFTSPKGIAFEVSQLGKEQPQLQYMVLRTTQIPGDIPRSRDNLFPLENALNNYKYTAPLLNSQPELMVGFFLFYKVLRRFNPTAEHLNYFDKEQSQMSLALQELSSFYDANEKKVLSAQSQNDQRELVNLLNQRKLLLEKINLIQSTRDERKSSIYKDDLKWDSYRTRYKSLKKLAEKDNLLAYYLKDPLKLLSLNGIYSETAQGLQIELEGAGVEILKTGLSRETVLKGDLKLAQLVLLAHVGYILDIKTKDRPTLSEFSEDFQLLEKAFQQ